MILATLLAAAACAATPVHGGVARAGTISVSVPGKQTAVLTLHAGGNQKVVWAARGGSGGFVVRGTRLDGSGGTFRESFHRAASIVDVPTAGCWRLTVSQGGATASFVARVVK